jgi:predicted phage replisome organizer
MADNEKYYYIKLKDSYFEQDNIKVLESMKNGHIYSLIIIKLYLKASKTDGQLMMTQRIPYDPNNVNILANVIGHDVDHVKEAIRLGVELDLIRVIEGREIWMTEIQNMIGQSSTEADRIRSYRKKLDEKLLPESNDVQMYDKSTPEIERETEKETENKEQIYTRFLEKWNTLGLVKHTEQVVKSKWKNKHTEQVNLYGEEKVFKAMENYATIIHSPSYFFDYKWPLWDFIARGLDKFVDDVSPLTNFKSKKIESKQSDPYAELNL